MGFCTDSSQKSFFDLFVFLFLSVLPFPGELLSLPDIQGGQMWPTKNVNNSIPRDAK